MRQVQKMNSRNRAEMFFLLNVKNEEEEEEWSKFTMHV